HVTDDAWLHGLPSRRAFRPWYARPGIRLARLDLPPPPGGQLGLERLKDAQLLAAIAASGRDPAHRHGPVERERAVRLEPRSRVPDAGDSASAARAPPVGHRWATACAGRRSARGPLQESTPRTYALSLGSRA